MKKISASYTLSVSDSDAAPPPAQPISTDWQLVYADGLPWEKLVWVRLQYVATVPVSISAVEVKQLPPEDASSPSA